jgi:SHS2 domain-containing protein
MTVKKDFEIIEHTADAGVRSYGETLEEAFVNIARGMTSLIVRPETIKENICREINISAPDRETLMVEWLNELIYYFDTENIVFKKFDIVHLTSSEIKVRCFGERIDRTIHEVERGIKAATYYMLKVERNSDGYSAQAFFDI